MKFGKNVKFPTKVYGNFTYPAGEYEAVLITIGKGEGANWWCVLFPPMCFLRFFKWNSCKKRRACCESRINGWGRTASKNTGRKRRGIGKTKSRCSVETKKGQETSKKEVVSKVQTTVKETNEKIAQEKSVKQEEKQLVEKIEKPLEKKQKQTIETVETEEQEEKPKVKLFIVEAFTSLFSK